MPLIIPCLIALVCAALGTWLVERYARRRLLDLPNARSSHSVPTPRGGGLGLAVGAGLGCLAAWLPGPIDAIPLAILGLIALMAALGWADDLWSLPARVRLLVQLGLCAGVVALLGAPDHGNLGGLAITCAPWLAFGLCTIGAAWLVNLTNFMDGIDGLAGSQGAIGCAASAWMLHLIGAPAWQVLLLASLSAACLGFLLRNWPPARIFMGDVGSTALGLAFACAVIAGLNQGLDLLSTLLPILPFILDASCTLLRRAWRREQLSEAHRSHLYQRLARHWQAHLPVTLLYAGLALLGAVGAWATQTGHIGQPVAALGLGTAFAGIAAYGRRVAPA